MPFLPNVPRCQHLKVNGTQCGSPALKRNRFCFFHKRFQEERIKLNCDRTRRDRATFVSPRPRGRQLHPDLPHADHAPARLRPNRFQNRRPAPLRPANRQLQPPPHHLRAHLTSKDVVIDRRTIDQTCIGGNQWSEEDFPDEEETEEEKAEAAVEQAAETAASAPSAIAARVGTAALGCPVEPSSTSSTTKPASIQHIPATQPLPPPPANKQPAAGQNKSAQSHRPSATAKLSKKKTPRKVDINKVREKIQGMARDWIMKTAKQPAHQASRAGRPEVSDGRLEVEN